MQAAGEMGGPLERSGFPPPSGGFTPSRCGLFLLRRSHRGFSEARDDLWRNTFGGRDHEPFRGATFFRLNRVVYLADDDGRTLGRGRKWPARKAGAEPQPDVHPGEPDPAGADEALAGEKHGPASRTRVRVRSVLTTAAT